MIDLGEFPLLQGCDCMFFCVLLLRFGPYALRVVRAGNASFQGVATSYERNPVVGKNERSRRAVAQYSFFESVYHLSQKPLKKLVILYRRVAPLFTNE